MTLAKNDVVIGIEGTFDGKKQIVCGEFHSSASIVETAPYYGQVFPTNELIAFDKTNPAHVGAFHEFVARCRETYMSQIKKCEAVIEQYKEHLSDEAAASRIHAVKERIEFIRMDMADFDARIKKFSATIEDLDNDDADADADSDDKLPK